MANNELLIKINADAKNAKKAFDDIKAQTADLEDSLQSVALVSGVAFAAFTAEIFASVHAFEEGQKAAIQLSTALQNQGIYTDELREKYEEYANTVEEATGIDNDALIKAQAVTQGYLKQTEVTLELTQAVADLGASMNGDLNAAAEKIGRTIGTNTNAFAKQGLVLSETATEAERMAAVLEFVRQKAGGLAAAFNQADGYSQALKTSFDNLQKAIGERFAPAFAAVRKGLSEFFDFFAKNPLLVDFTVALLSAGAVITGIIAVLALAVPAFTALSAAAAAFGLTLSASLLGIPLLIGSIVAGIVFLTLNWERSMKAISEASAAAVKFITELFSGLGTVLSGVFTLNPSKIKEGLDKIKNAALQTKDDFVKIGQEFAADREKERQVQDVEKKKAADKEAQKEREHQALLRSIRANEIELLKLQNQNASEVIIGLKQKEIETLKNLSKENSAAEIAVYQERLTKIRELEEQAQAEEIERTAAFEQLKIDTQNELNDQKIETDAQLSAQRLAQIQATAQTEADIDRKLQDDILTKRVAARNQELLDRKKYGESYAKINAAINSDEVQGVKSASSELVALQQSKNATLKTIGKVAAVAQITIATSESAMNIFRGFSTIPIIGPALGIAGAAAAVAFGAERISGVLSAQDGGLVTGGIPGKDSVPAILAPGELVVPERNFDQVVGSVKGENGPDNTEVVALLGEINAKFSNPQTNIIQGDVLTDDSFVDSLIKKISDAIEFRNAQIVGVTS